MQNEFSLLNRHDRSALLPWLVERGIGYLAYGPLRFGLLTGAIGPDTTFPEGDWRGAQRAGSRAEGEGPFFPGNFERNLELVERIRPIAERLGMSLATLALRWDLEQRGVTATIAGSRNADHVRSNAEAGSVRLEQSTLEEMEAMFGA